MGESLKSEHRGRFQAQGEDVGEPGYAQPWSQDVPRLASCARKDIDDLKRSCSPSEQQRRETPFAKARRMVDNAEKAGGVDAPVSKSYNCNDKQYPKARVDIEVNSGRAFTPKPKEKS